MSGSPPIRLEAADLAVLLGGIPVLAGIGFALPAGTLAAIVGPNGAGKTTLVRALAGLIPASGQITLDGLPLPGMKPAERARRLSYLPQGHGFHWPLSVADVVALGRLPHGAGAGSLGETDREAVARAVATAGIGALLDRPVTSLSGGERARVALARVLAVEAPVILADEPTAALDPRYQLVVLAVLRQVADAGGTVVAVMHDLAQAARFADRVLVLDRGHLVADGAPAEVLTADRLAETFGVAAALLRDGDRTIALPWSLA